MRSKRRKIPISIRSCKSPRRQIGRLAKGRSASRTDCSSTSGQCLDHRWRARRRCARCRSARRHIDRGDEIQLRWKASLDHRHPGRSETDENAHEGPTGVVVQDTARSGDRRARGLRRALQGQHVYRAAAAQPPGRILGPGKVHQAMGRAGFRGSVATFNDRTASSSILSPANVCR